MHEWEINNKCRAAIKKASKKNPVLRRAIKNKIQEIIVDPFRYKHLKHGLAGELRVHILKSFVLVYEIKGSKVIFLRFRHHDEAY